MAVGLRVGSHYWELGTGEFLHAFFSTISYHLEPGGWGSRFPRLMNDLYQGHLPAAAVDQALQELAEARRELKNFPPSRVIWGIDNLSAAPPWGTNISPDITDLANYFVTSDGRDLFEVMERALTYQKKTGRDLRIA